jgi:23S rRNA pseudouridine2604 synthase
MSAIIIQSKDKEPIRINKFLAQNGICSRRKAEELINNGAVSVDGIAISDLGRKIEFGQIVSIDESGKNKLEQSFSIIINKPIDYVSSQPQPDDIPAIRLINAQNQFGDGKIPPKDMIIPSVGRLDKDSHGLLILSQNGVLARNIIAPESIIEKEYIVKVDGIINQSKIAKLCHGLSLDGRKLKPAKVVHIDQQTLNFTLIEGRNRQIRRMCALLGLDVYDLQRIRIGKVSLGDLPMGKWRHLTNSEIESFSLNNK